MTVRVNNTSSFPHRVKQTGKLRMKRMRWIMIDFEEHAQTAYEATVPQVSIKIRLLSKSLRCESAAENQTREQYSKQDKIKELKHFNKTHGSPNIL